MTDKKRLEEIEAKLGDPEFVTTAPAEEIEALREEWGRLRGRA